MIQFRYCHRNILILSFFLDELACVTRKKYDLWSFGCNFHNYWMYFYAFWPILLSVIININVVVLKISIFLNEVHFSSICWQTEFKHITKLRKRTKVDLHSNSEWRAISPIKNLSRDLFYRDIDNGFQYYFKQFLGLWEKKRVGLIESLAWSDDKFNKRLNIDVEPIVDQ